METGVAVSRKTDALEISLDGRLIYDIELGAVKTPEQVQFWLRQINDKTWCSPEVLSSVIREVDAAQQAPRPAPQVEAVRFAGNSRLSV